MSEKNCGDVRSRLESRTLFHGGRAEFIPDADRRTFIIELSDEDGGLVSEIHCTPEVRRFPDETYPGGYVCEPVSVNIGLVLDTLLDEVPLSERDRSWMESEILSDFGSDIRSSF